MVNKYNQGPDGKQLNKFALDERCMGRSYAMKVWVIL